MEALEYLRFLLALAFIVGLIVIIAWAAKRYGLAPRISGNSNGRLGVVAVQTVDTRRKLILIRRDDREHLILIGPTADTIVETGIAPQSGAPE